MPLRVVQSIETLHVCVCALVSTDPRAQRFVLATECTQKSDSHSQMHLPARSASQIPVLPANVDTPGCERSDTGVDIQLRSDNQGAAAAAGAVGDVIDNNSSSHARNRNTSSATPHQQTAGPALPQPQVPVRCCN